MNKIQAKLVINHLNKITYFHIRADTFDEVIVSILPKLGVAVINTEVGFANEKSSELLVISVKIRTLCKSIHNTSR